MGRIAGRLVGVPVVVNTCHGLWARPEDSVAKRAFVYGLEALAARFSDYELFQNAEDEATLRRFLKRGKHRVVGNGVDLTRFTRDPEGRRRVRAELGVDNNELLVGTVGRRVREKGLTEFAHAARRLGDKATFVWVGPADGADADAAAVDRSAVRFVDERTDMPAVYSAFDIFVLASHREGFSRASMEAAACGLPMVLTNIRGCREIGRDGVHLLLTSPQDGAALLQGVDRLISDASLRTRLAHASRERALREFNQRVVAQASLDTYARVAATKRRSRPEDRLTVLHVLPTDLARGAQVYAAQLRDALADDLGQRHLVVALFEAPPGGLRPDVQLRVSSGMLRRLGFDPRSAWALRRAIRAERASLVVAHGGEPLKYAVAAFGRVPIVYYKVGLSSTELSRRSRQWLYRALVSRAAQVVGVSRAILDQAHAVLGVPEAKLSLIPNGRDERIYHPPPDVDDRAHPPLMLFIGQLEEGKRPDLFLDVVDILRAKGIEFEASVVGDGPLRPAVEGRAGALGVTVLGIRNDVPNLLRRASVLVMTSDPATEGMPGVLIEAGLSGVPVVTTAAAGVNDVVSDGVTGSVVDTGLAVDLARRVGALLEDAHLRQQLGANARRWCEEEFSLSATAGLWRNLVSKVAKQSGRTMEAATHARLVNVPNERSS